MNCGECAVWLLCAVAACWMLASDGRSLVLRKFLTLQMRVEGGIREFEKKKKEKKTFVWAYNVFRV